MSAVVSRPSIESFSDLVFGLALSIGALALIGRPVSNETSVVADIVAFAYSFAILTTVWMRYTAVVRSLRPETALTIRLNLAMLFLVAVEPYLFNLVFATSGGPSLDPFNLFVASLFALDLGGLFGILAIFNHLAIRSGTAEIDTPRRTNFRVYRTRHLIAAACFLLSAIPLFGTWLIFSTTSAGLTAREVLWIVPLVVGAASRRAEWFRLRRASPKQ